MRALFVLSCVAAVSLPIAGSAQAPAPQAAAPPAFETRKVDGTEGVYIFRYGNAQSMFIVTPDGVIATDPVGYGRTDRGQVYLGEIRKITNAPVRYVIYSHQHIDHTAGGQALKEAGATFIAHRNAKARLERLRDPNTVIPDDTVDRSRSIRLGGTTLELTYVGPNHSDSTLVMRLPRERIIFAVDFLHGGAVGGRGFIDSYPLEWEQSIEQVLKMEWDRLIPGQGKVRWAEVFALLEEKRYAGHLSYEAPNPLLWGRPFLFSAYGYVKLPGTDDSLHLASVLGFDLGVFMVVTGTVLGMINAVSEEVEER